MLAPESSLFLENFSLDLGGQLRRNFHCTLSVMFHQIAIHRRPAQTIRELIMNNKTNKKQTLQHLDSIDTGLPVAPPHVAKRPWSSVLRPRGIVGSVEVL